MANWEEIRERIMRTRIYHDEVFKDRSGPTVDHGLIQGIEVPKDEAERIIRRLTHGGS